MPPLPRLRIAALDELARQLRFAPGETLRRQIARARVLAAEIDPTRNYAEDVIIQRITGYRPQIEAPAMLVGEALLSDISALVERLCAAAGLKESDVAAEAHLDAVSVCARWSISRKTLDRYRRRGLVALRVVGPAGRARMLFPMDAVEAFERQNAAIIAEAAGFNRMDSVLSARLVQCAARYRRAGLTLNQAAARLARRYGRGHETVRQLLRRSAAEVFAERGPPTRRERRLIERSHWLAIDPSTVARHLGRSRASIQRVLTDERSMLLRQLELQVAAAPTRRSQGRKDVEQILSSIAASEGLGEPGATDLLALVEMARQIPPPAASQEQARAAAYQALIGRAAGAIAGLPAHGARATVVDRIETDLRWAARLKAALVRSQLGQVVRTFESTLQRPLEEVRSGHLAVLMSDGIAAVALAVDSFDPTKGGRLAAPVGLALNRLMARFVREHEAAPAGPPRARAVHRLSSGVMIADWTISIAPWQRRGSRWWLEPDPRVRMGLSVLEERERVLLMVRFGWSGRPMTHIELAARFETTPMRIAQRERAAVRAAMAAARAEGGS